MDPGSSECSYALGRWLEHGLMGLYRHDQTNFHWTWRTMKPAGF